MQSMHAFGIYVCIVMLGLMCNMLSAIKGTKAVLALYCGCNLHKCITHAYHDSQMQ